MSERAEQLAVIEISALVNCHKMQQVSVSPPDKLFRLFNLDFKHYEYEYSYCTTASQKLSIQKFSATKSFSAILLLPSALATSSCKCNKRQNTRSININCSLSRTKNTKNTKKTITRRAQLLLNVVSYPERAAGCLWCS